MFMELVRSSIASVSVLARHASIEYSNDFLFRSASYVDRLPSKSKDRSSVRTFPQISRVRVEPLKLANNVSPPEIAPSLCG